MTSDLEIFHLYTRIGGMTFGKFITGAREVVRFCRDELHAQESVVDVRSHRTEDHWDRIRKALGEPQSWERTHAHIDPAA